MVKTQQQQQQQEKHQRNNVSTYFSVSCRHHIEQSNLHLVVVFIALQLGKVWVLRLLSLASTSRCTTTNKKSYHSYIGKASMGVWAFRKFRPFVLGREFTWMTHACKEVGHTDEQYYEQYNEQYYEQWNLHQL